ncbi:DUF302 domain-containing protein [Winogradskyella bathintestinalis]|uniref:DUF302 domain-containing protein n=1 Tax=Winogradskyella bathintestinalis TaxID=3035208 RepID=A0ABT7ZXQ4_9FLAO|nr:DUF302 domain-containing protein [Winogradskyella bathintestinalis]MDN3493783.1 DUF302 domain-containing protein [Winogradskyella bathintestinalis]
MKTRTITALLFSTLLLSTACKDDNDNNTPPQNNSPETEGIGYVETNDTPSSIYNAIITILNNNNEIGIVAEVDHALNAENNGLALDFTRTIYFGNPNLGTPVMQSNIQAGLDLPQRITVYTDEDGDTVVTYNSIDYIINRHAIGNVETTDMIKNALANIVNTATEKDVTINVSNAEQDQGIISLASDNDFNSTYSSIIDKLNSIDNITIMAELDHQANAQSVDFNLMPAKLIIFGNPILGTPLMVESKTAALDLPQKMLVYENNNGEVFIIYNDPFYMADRHDIDNNNETLTTISNALQNIANAGASPVD